MTICSDVFATLGEAESRQFGLPDLPLAVLPHPIGSLEPEAAADLGRRSADRVAACFLEAPPSRQRAVAEVPSAEMPEGPADQLDFTDFMLARGWGDGLPVIAPTPDRVRRLVESGGQAAGEVLGSVPPRWGEVTVEVAAANAVMAGCRPSAFPVVLAALEGVLRPTFNLYGIQATTGSVGPLVVVSGPLATAAGIHGGAGCLGPGWTANATIGRALRMILSNVGGALPGGFDRSTHGQPGKFGLCVAELEEGNPWQPLHRGRGSLVLVTGVMGTQDVIDYASSTGEELLQMLAGSVGGTAVNHVLFGGYSTLLVCPEHARLLSDAGLSRDDVAAALCKRAGVPASAFPPATWRMLHTKRPHLFAQGEPDRIPVFDSPGHLQLVVCGGMGPHSAFLPAFGDLADPQEVWV